MLSAVAIPLRVNLLVQYLVVLNVLNDILFAVVFSCSFNSWYSVAKNVLKLVHVFSFCGFLLHSLLASVYKFDELIA